MNPKHHRPDEPAACMNFMITFRRRFVRVLSWVAVAQILSAHGQTKGTDPPAPAQTKSPPQAIEHASADVDATPIDLTEFYGKASGTEGDEWFSHEDWKIVPKGLQTFQGILFDVSGTLLLRSQNMPQLKEVVRGIPVKTKARYIHLL